MFISCMSIKIDDFTDGSYKILMVKGSDNDFKKIIYNSNEVIRENLILKFDKSINHFYILNNEKVISSFEKDGDNNQVIHYAPQLVHESFRVLGNVSKLVMNPIARICFRVDRRNYIPCPQRKSNQE